VLGLIGEAPIARVEIARQLRLSQATVTEVTRELVDTGLVQVVDQGPSSGGRPPLLLGIVAGAAEAVGVKISADHLAFVRVSLDGEILAADNQPFDPTSADALDVIADSLAAFVPQGGTAKLLGIGLGVPGLVDGRGNVEAPIFGWHDVALGPTLRKRLRVPILIDNDVNTLAVAERLYGRGRGVDHFLTVTIGRGVGLGIIIGGDLYRGWLGGAGEFGHVAVSAGGPVCECGKRGCLEALVADPPAKGTNGFGLGVAGSPAMIDVLATGSGTLQLGNGDPLEGEGSELIADAVRASRLSCERVGEDLLVSAQIREW